MYSHQIPHKIRVNSDIILEKIEQQHAISLFTQLDKHRQFFKQFVDWIDFNKTVEDSLNFVNTSKKEAEDGLGFVWVISYKGDVVGAFSLNNPIDWENKIAELGYWLSPDVQGKGIITQSVNQVIEETKSLFNHYRLRCAVHNLKSNAIADRCQFQFIGVEGKGLKIGEQYYDLNIYSKILLVRER
ncbi:GNAT family N-acetyltransferase [Otariodibacter sp.]|uniref:GNAT family N-acetyltransferase n=1 Tax=Otariodibacter sp. TaxID=3030919 RepID=UPI002627971B|nr:GNAT family N-acetyltransferase [Otariodibacter sp.]